MSRYLRSCPRMLKQITQHIREWFARVDPETDTFRYLRSNRDALSDEDRVFVRLMQKRRQADLPLHEQHRKRLTELAKEIWLDEHC